MSRANASLCSIMRAAAASRSSARLGAGMSRHDWIGPRRGVDRGVRVGLGRVLEQSNHVALVRRIPVLEGPARHRLCPRARDVVLVCPHGRLSVRWESAECRCPLDRLQREPKDGENPETPTSRDQFLTLRSCRGNRLLRKGLAPKTTCGPQSDGVPHWHLTLLVATEMRVLRSGIPVAWFLYRSQVRRAGYQNALHQPNRRRASSEGCRGEWQYRGARHARVRARRRPLRHGVRGTW